MEYQKRIIIGGLPRSGSTLLRFLMDASSSIISGAETAFFTQPLYQLQSQVCRWAGLLSAKLEISEDDVKDVILSAKTSYGAYDGISDLLARQAGVNKPCWAEKTPRNCFSYHWLHAENPDFYFITTIRHGLDVVTSVIDNHPTRSNEYWCPIQRYVDTMSAIYSFKQPRHMIIKYEDLVTEPKDTARRVFDFLELPFEEQIIENFNKPTVTSNPKKVHQPRLDRPIGPDRVNRWKKDEYTSRIEEFMQHTQARYWLEYSGYGYDR